MEKGIFYLKRREELVDTFMGRVFLARRIDRGEGGRGKKGDGVKESRMPSETVPAAGKRCRFPERGVCWEPIQPTACFPRNPSDVGSNNSLTIG